MRILPHKASIQRPGWAIASAVLILAAAFTSCGGSHTSSSADDAGQRVKMRYAALLTIADYPGYTKVTVKNPWDTLKTLGEYLLVPKDSVLPTSLPQGKVIRTPVSNALVYSTIHGSLISELGAQKSIGGMCDVDFVGDPVLKRRLREGSVKNCGLSQNPNIEAVIALNPDIIMVSPYENGDNSKVESLGIPVLECADYMETSPLGKAEWMRFYGLLFGVNEKSEEIFSRIESEYIDLKEKAANAKEKPKVLTDQRYGQSWNVPCGESTMGKLIVDAGGVNPFSSYDRSGSVALSPEKVLSEAYDADIWLVRYNQKEDKTLNELAADSPVNSQFKAFKEGNVYGSNTEKVNLFEDTPFHPERLLRDMVIMMHPGLLGSEKPVYFHKIK